MLRPPEVLTLAGSDWLSYSWLNDSIFGFWKLRYAKEE